MAELNKRSKRVGAFLNPSRPVRLEGDTLVVEVQAKWHEEEMGKPQHKALLSDALHDALGIRPSLAFVAKGSRVGPAEQAPADSLDAYEEARPLSPDEHDPVELVKRGLGAEVVEEIGSRER